MSVELTLEQRREFSKHVSLDPKGIDTDKALAALGDFIPPYNPEDFFFGEVVCYVAGTYTMADLLDTVDSERLEREGKYWFSRGAGETTIVAYKDALHKLNEEFKGNG